MDKKLSRIVVEYLGLIIGCLIVSTGINMFFKPFTIAPGGLSGLSLVISKMTGLSVSAIMLMIGIPLLIFSIRILGKEDSLKTLIGLLVLSLSFKVTEPLSAIRATEDVLLSAISGSIATGVGLGIIFRVDASTGGTDLIALLLHRMFKSVSVSKFLLLVDGIVVILAGIAGRNLETALYSAISLYIITRVIDAIISGFEYSKAFMIITNEPEKLRHAIVNDIKKGVTILDAKGGYTNQSKSILLVVVNKKQHEVALKKLIKNEDSNSFIIVSDVHEVLGEGFNTIAV